LQGFFNAPNGLPLRLTTRIVPFPAWFLKAERWDEAKALLLYDSTFTDKDFEGRILEI